MFANIFLCRLLQSNDIKSLVNSKTLFQSSLRILATKELSVWQMLKTNDMLLTTIRSSQLKMGIKLYSNGCQLQK